MRQRRAPTCPTDLEARARRATASSCSTRAALRRQEPGRAARGARDRGRAASAGIAGRRRARAGLAAAAERVRRRDRHQRQDDHGRAARRDLPRGRGCRWRWPATSARRCRALVGAVDPARDGRLRGVELPARGRGRASRPTSALLLNLAPDHLDRHGTLRGLPRRQAAPVRPPGRRDAGRGRARLASTLPRATARRVPTRRELPLARRPRTRSACAAPTTSRTRWARGRRGAGARASPPEAVRRGAARLRRRAAPPRGGGRRVDGVLYVNDSKATNVAAAARGDRVVRRRRARDPRRQPQGRRLRGPARAGRASAAAPAT